MHAIRLALVAALVMGWASRLNAQESFARQAVLITVKLTNAKSTATGFILTRDDGRRVLVTAAHVFERASGDTVSVYFRARDDKHAWIKVPTALEVRADDKPLWTQHPSADVAVIDIAVPENCTVPAVGVEMLATKEEFAARDPGDLVRTVCYPHAAVFEPSEAAFPIVRLGCIASYPDGLDARKDSFVVDCNTFEGDSGGLVYWKSDAEPPAYKILGIVHGQHWVNLRLESSYETFELRKRLGLAIITHADTVRETLAKLP